MALKTHKFDGRIVMPCAYLQHTERGERWYLRVERPDGLVLAEEISPRFATLAQARQYIADQRAARG